MRGTPTFHGNGNRQRTKKESENKQNNIFFDCNFKVSNHINYDNTALQMIKRWRKYSSNN